MEEMESRLKDISEIRSMMERSSKFLSLSGLAGVGAGTVALAGAALAYRQLKMNEALAEKNNLLTFFIADAVLVLILAIGLAILFTTRMAKKKALPVWTTTTKHMLASLLIPLGTGGLFCFILWYHGLVMLIAPSTLIFYGLALLNTSKYTVAEIRYLALAEIILGLLATLMLESWLVLWAIGFGLLHIAYGIFMYVKFEK
jgi:predicted lysophospholipase L1 biosynthesis ABC-type transport system permease subunit